LWIVWDWYLQFARSRALLVVPGGVVVICGKKKSKKKSVPQYNYSIEAIMEGTFEGGGEMDASLFTMYPEGWW